MRTGGVPASELRRRATNKERIRKLRIKSRRDSASATSIQ